MVVNQVPCGTSGPPNECGDSTSAPMDQALDLALVLVMEMGHQSLDLQLGTDDGLWVRSLRW